MPAAFDAGVRGEPEAHRTAIQEGRSGDVRLARRLDQLRDGSIAGQLAQCVGIGDDAVGVHVDAKCGLIAARDGPGFVGTGVLVNRADRRRFRPPRIALLAATDVERRLLAQRELQADAERLPGFQAIQATVHQSRDVLRESGVGEGRLHDVEVIGTPGATVADGHEDGTTGAVQRFPHLVQVSLKLLHIQKCGGRRQLQRALLQDAAHVRLWRPVAEGQLQPLLPVLRNDARRHGRGSVGGAGGTRSCTACEQRNDSRSEQRESGATGFRLCAASEGVNVHRVTSNSRETGEIPVMLIRQYTGREDSPASTAEASPSGDEDASSGPDVAA